MSAWPHYTAEVYQVCFLRMLRRSDNNPLARRDDSLFSGTQWPTFKLFKQRSLIKWLMKPMRITRFLKVKQICFVP
jgi:hypothetical protein